jgi:hypothetical protein
MKDVIDGFYAVGWIANFISHDPGLVEQKIMVDVDVLDSQIERISSKVV